MDARYVTLIADPDVADGWRDRRADGGLLMDVGTSEALLRGLSMPHSPRMDAGRAWLLNSGTGELGYCDGDAKTFVPVAFCPACARGRNAAPWPAAPRRASRRRTHADASRPVGG